jgi:hypothetical protein
VLGRGRDARGEAALAFLAWMLVAMRNDASPGAQGIIFAAVANFTGTWTRQPREKKSTASKLRSWRVSLIRERALRKVVVPSSVDTAAIPRK